MTSIDACSWDQLKGWLVYYRVTLETVQARISGRDHLLASDPPTQRGKTREKIRFWWPLHKKKKKVPLLTTRYLRSLSGEVPSKFRLFTPRKRRVFVFLIKFDNFKFQNKWTNTISEHEIEYFQILPTVWQFSRRSCTKQWRYIPNNDAEIYYNYYRIWIKLYDD